MKLSWIVPLYFLQALKAETQEAQEINADFAAEYDGRCQLVGGASSCGIVKNLFLTPEYATYTDLKIGLCKKKLRVQLNSASSYSYINNCVYNLDCSCSASPNATYSAAVITDELLNPTTVTGSGVTDMINWGSCYTMTPIDFVNYDTNQAKGCVKGNGLGFNVGVDPVSPLAPPTFFDDLQTTNGFAGSSICMSFDPARYGQCEEPVGKLAIGVLNSTCIHNGYSTYNYSFTNSSSYVGPQAGFQVKLQSINNCSSPILVPTSSATAIIDTSIPWVTITTSVADFAQSLGISCLRTTQLGNGVQVCYLDEKTVVPPISVTLTNQNSLALPAPLSTYFLKDPVVYLNEGCRRVRALAVAKYSDFRLGTSFLNGLSVCFSYPNITTNATDSFTTTYTGTIQIGAFQPVCEECN